MTLADETTSRLALTVGLASASAVAFAVAIVMQQHGAAAASDHDARSTRFIGHLVRSRSWLAGVAGDVVGFGLQSAALAVGSVLVVAPILVTSLLFALPLGAAIAHERLTRAARVSGLLLVASLVIFVVLGHPNAGLDFAAGRSWIVVSVIGVPLLVFCLLVANRRLGTIRAALLATMVGVLGGVLSVLTKAVVTAAGDGVTALLTTGETYGLVVVGLGGFYLQQLAFQAGSLQASMPIMIVLEPVTAAALGFLLLDEQLDVTGAQTLVLVVAMIVMALSTIVLARVHAGAQPGD